MIMELDHSPITEYFAIRVSFILLLINLIKPFSMVTFVF